MTQISGGELGIGLTCADLAELRDSIVVKRVSATKGEGIGGIGRLGDVVFWKKVGEVKRQCQMPQAKAFPWMEPFVVELDFSSFLLAERNLVGTATPCPKGASIVTLGCTDASCAVTFSSGLPAES